MSLLDALQWLGCILGVGGSWLLARHDHLSRWGWSCYLLANAAMLGFAIPAGAWGLAAQQVAFSATSLLGLHRAFRKPVMASR